MHQLKDACADHHRGVQRDYTHPLWLAEWHLAKLSDGNPLQVSYSRATLLSLLNNVRLLVKHLSDAVQDTGSPPNPQSAPVWLWYMVRNDLEIFEHLFGAELKKTSAYAVPDRGIFKTEGLVDAVMGHIHESVRSWVPEFARAEFCAAGRCLAFGLYERLDSSSQVPWNASSASITVALCPVQPTDNLTMGQMASALGDMHKATEKAARLPKENTVRRLKEFVSFDRNPLMHKTVVLEEIDAATVFNSATAVISEMAKKSRRSVTTSESRSRSSVQFAVAKSAEDAS